VVRTLDVGGDKPIGGMAARGEANPFLGVRGCRLYARMPDIFRAQVRAILRAAASGQVEVLFPMVSTEAEARELRAAVEEERAALGAAAIRVGLMIEVPAAAIAADRLAAHADFFSIGTNDLAQYLFAADRTNPDVAPLADALHPALLRAIAAATRAGRAAGIPSTVCGEMAARPAAVPLLVGLGVVELSVATGSLPIVKEAVRRTDSALAARVAEEALALGDASEVRALVFARFPGLRELEPRGPAE
jgi:phosphocarrier protein FPr